MIKAVLVAPHFWYRLREDPVLRIYRRDLGGAEIAQLAAEDLAATTTVNGAGTATTGGAGSPGAPAGAAGGATGSHHWGHGIGAGVVLAASLLGLSRRARRARHRHLDLGPR